MPENKPANSPQGAFRERAMIATLLFVLAIIPILLTPIPPVTDLPQHIAQARLFKETLANPDGPYIIQWLAPNNLIYVFLLVFWTVLPLGLITRAALIVIVLLWLAAIHGLGAVRSRAPATVAIVSLLIFNQSFYWGFLNFLIGFPVFILWFVLTTRDPEKTSWKLIGALAVTSFFLYESHALWFAAGAAWLILIALVKKASVKTALWRFAALVPCGLIAFSWYPDLSAFRAMAGFDTAPHWSPLFDRLASFLDAAFGGIRGPVETIVFVFLLLWAGLSIWQNRTRLKDGTDRDLLAAALFFLAIVIVSPDKYMNTIFFSSRWFPAAMVFLLLALPAPSFRRASPKVIALAVALLFSLITAFAWRSFETRDLSGFRGSLARIQDSSRVLGLDLGKESEHIKGRPFLQLFAYAQVFKGGELNFSFAEHYSGLVAYKAKRDVRWTAGLEWHGEKVKRTDFAFFDFVLVNGEEKDHQILGRFPELSPLTHLGKWRLYEVKKP
ncbi:MAG: hypothetical protein ABSG73_02885 [Candidatus Aminicenantales bacterium]|jgi:hypothetical protein